MYNKKNCELGYFIVSVKNTHKNVDGFRHNSNIKYLFKKIAVVFGMYDYLMGNFVFNFKLFKP